MKWLTDLKFPSLRGKRKAGSVQTTVETNDERKQI